MGMLKEAQEHGLQVNYLPLKVHCTVFEDNSGALELAWLPKIHPRTKHINQSFHHFREYVERQEVTIQATNNWPISSPSHSWKPLSRAIAKRSWVGE